MKKIKEIKYTNEKKKERGRKRKEKKKKKILTWDKMEKPTTTTNA